MRLLYGEDEKVAAWAAQRMPDASYFGPCVALGFETDDGKLIAGLVFHNWRENCRNIEASMAADSAIWARPHLLAEALAYPFLQLGCWMVYTLTDPNNDRALRVNRHLGFSRKTIIPHAYGPKRHAVLCQMTKPIFLSRYEEWMNGQERPVAAATA